MQIYHRNILRFFSLFETRVGDRTSYLGSSSVICYKSSEVVHKGNLLMSDNLASSELASSELEAVDCKGLGCSLRDTFGKGLKRDTELSKSKNKRKDRVIADALLGKYSKHY